MSYSVSSPDEQILGSEDIINVSDVRLRIGKLFPYHVESEDTSDVSLAAFKTREEGEHWITQQPPADIAKVVFEYSWEADELTALTQLLADLGDVSDSSWLVHDGYLVTYVQDYSEMSDECPLFMYVDWEQVADDLYRGGHDSVSFRDSTYWVVGQ